jgi:hypothetical protein
MNQSEVLGKGTVGAVDDVVGKDKRESVFRCFLWPTKIRFLAGNSVLVQVTGCLVLI